MLLSINVFFDKIQILISNLLVPRQLELKHRFKTRVWELTKIYA